MPANQQDFLVKNGMTVRSTATISTIDSFLTTATNTPGLPTLNLSFIASDILDPRVSFSRSSAATYVGKDGIVKYADLNQPRFDYSSSSTGKPLGLLIEEQRTNYSTYGSDVGNPASWGLQVGIAGSANFIRNYTTAPDGTPSATFLYHTTSTPTYKNLGQTITISTGQSYTFSIWAKNAGEPIISSTHYDSHGALNSYNFNYNWATDTFSVPYMPGTTETSIALPTRDIYPNGWIRIQYTVYWNAGPTRAISFKWELDSATALAGRGFYLWGSQVENNSYNNTSSNYATSYIPTPTSAAGTRLGDVALVSGSSFNKFFRRDQGTVYVEFDTYVNGSALLTGNNPGLWAIYDPTNISYNGYGIRIINNTNFNPFQVGSRLGSLFQGTGVYSPNYVIAGAVYKISASYYSGYISSNQQGQVATITSDNNYGLMNLTSISLGYQYIGGNPTQLNGHIRKFSYYPSVLSDLQQQTLTSATLFTATSLADVVPRTSRTASTSNFVVQQGVVIQRNLEIPDVDKYYVTTQTRPSQQSALNLNFLTGTLDPKITFSRVSQATYIGQDGVVKYASINQPRFDYSPTNTGTCLGLLIEDTRTNLATYSSQMIPGLWGIGVNSTYLGEAIAPDGTLTASRVVGNGSGGNEYLARSIVMTSSTIYTASIWARLESGTVPTVGTILSISYTTDVLGTVARSTVTYNGNLTGNWQRFSTTYTNVTATTQTAFFIADQNNTAIIQCWGAQVEASPFVTSYIPTTSATATRSNDVANISGQNFNSWYNINQGTLVVEADTISSVNDTGNFRWVASLSSGFGQKIGFFKSPNNMSMYYKMTDDAYNSKFEAPLSTVSTNTTFKIALSYQSGSQFSILNAISSATNTATTIPALVVDNLRIGGGDAVWCGHIRRIVYYNQKLSNTATQALTLL